jgi:dephospho-CoA kinase
MTARRPVVVGLTGNIATGKSAVGKMMAELGAEVIDADLIAHQVMLPGTQEHQKILDAFGESIALASGGIDRRRLGQLVFSSPEAMRQLEAIVHPRTIAEVRRRTASTSARVIVHEAIKLVESGMADECDEVWVTTCAREVQIERLIQHRGMTLRQATLRVDAQAPQELKLSRADIVIDTNGDLSHTRKQILAAWERFPAAGHDQSHQGLPSVLMS